MRFLKTETTTLSENIKCSRTYFANRALGKMFFIISVGYQLQPLRTKLMYCTLMHCNRADFQVLRNLPGIYKLQISLKRNNPNKYLVFCLQKEMYGLRAV